MLTNVVAPDKLGGLERYVRELSATLVAQGHEVFVIAKRISASDARWEEAEDGVTIVRYDVGSKRNPLFALLYPLAVFLGVRRSLRIIRRRAPSRDVTVLHGHYPMPMFGIRRPYIYTCHAPVNQEIADERQGTYWLPRWAQSLAISCVRTLERHILLRATTVVTLSGFVEEEVRTLARGARIDVARVPGGLDTSRFAPDARARRPREIQGQVIFTARRLVARTGVEQLVEAMSLVRTQAPAATLVVAGDGRRAAHVRTLIAELGLSERVHLLGRISDAELLQWYQCADLAVTPTQQLEGFGLSTAEAMSAGAVPLVTPVGANAELVEHLDRRLITKSARAEDLARGIVALLEDDLLRSEVRERVRDVVHPSMGWQAVANRYTSLYKGLED